MRAASLAVAAVGALGVLRVCSAAGPDDWVACAEPVRVEPVDWADDPEAARLVAEAAGTGTGGKPRDYERIELRHRQDLAKGMARVARNAEGVLVQAQEFTDAARVVVALCNGRLSVESADREVRTGPDRLWAHFVARTLTEHEIAGLLRSIAAAGYHGVIIEVGAWFRSASLPEAAEAGAPDAAAWSRLAFLGHTLGLAVVPEVKLLTHQQKLLGLSPRYAAVRINAYTYDPRNPELRQLVTRYLDEVIHAFDPGAVHIGHDEAALSNDGIQALRPEDRRLTPAEFLTSVRWLDALLSERGLETWMWADMLLDPARFPGLPKGEQNGAGGFARIAGELPRRVVLVDWHYYTPAHCNEATRWLRGIGFRVMTAGWSRADALACQIRSLREDPPAARAEGQVVTTWFHVQRREWSKVGSILREGARLYRAAFPG